jgi:pyrroloquinoline quinone biosynthesis protein D
MISDETVLRRLSDVRFRAVEDETVVIRQEAAEALVLNEVAGRILELVDGKRTAAEIAETLIDEYEVDADTLRIDVLSYLGELVETGVLTTP